MQKRRILLIAVLAFVLTACRAELSTPQTTAAPTTAMVNSPTPTSKPSVTPEAPVTPGPIVFPKIDRHPSAADYHRGKMTALPTYDPNSDEMWQMDLRSYDLTALDFRNSLDDLLFASFDDRTIWPPDDKMPDGFDRERIMEFGKNPGLGLRSLHSEGITGTNIGIAIIDQTMLVDHQEYKDRIRLYEETEDITGGWRESQMHGPAVASIAVGKNLGVAPGADLYFIANVLCARGDFSCLAKSVLRIIEINRQLLPDRKIRVLSMSIGWGQENDGYAEITNAVQAARDAGIFVICSSERDIYGFSFQGLGRLPIADPDNPNSYGPGSWWAKYYYDGQQQLTDTLLVPMDSRTTASPTGVDEYVYYREGGWSWSIPYIAGVYALAAQVKPDITPEVFWSSALQTGKTIKITHQGQEYSFGVIFDPVALIHALQEG